MKSQKLLTASLNKNLAKDLLAEGFMDLVIRATVLTFLLCMASTLFYHELFLSGQWLETRTQATKPAFII